MSWSPSANAPTCGRPQKCLTDTGRSQPCPPPPPPPLPDCYGELGRCCPARSSIKQKVEG
eukprot:1192762-Amphidinium_carterae.1